MRHLGVSVLVPTLVLTLSACNKPPAPPAAQTAATPPAEAPDAPTAAAADAALSPADFLKQVNLDPDKTLDKPEIEAYAKKRFTALDGDNDGTLDASELAGRVNPAPDSQANPDNDTTMDQNEFVAYADKLFDAANPDGDTTLELGELQSPAGAALIQFLR